MSLLKDEHTAEDGRPDASQGPLPSSARNLSPAGSPPPAPHSHFLAVAARIWYSIICSACYAISQGLFRFRFVGKPNVPLSGPVLLLSNHQSNLDPVLVGVACPRQLKYLARQGLFFWPFSWWIKALGAVPIDRDRGSISGIRTTLKLLKQGEAVLVFPEGARTLDGALHELLPGFCLLARRSNATLVPVAIDGAFQALPRGAVIPRPARISLAFGQPIPPDQVATLNEEQLVAIVTERLNDAICVAVACRTR
jgi:1-acyl-sn-glycerol-3-phosphate acyltransferase